MRKKMLRQQIGFGLLGLTASTCFFFAFRSRITKTPQNSAADAQKSVTTKVRSLEECIIIISKDISQANNALETSKLTTEERGKFFFEIAIRGGISLIQPRAIGEAISFGKAQSLVEGILSRNKPTPFLVVYLKNHPGVLLDLPVESIEQLCRLDDGWNEAYRVVLASAIKAGRSCTVTVPVAIELLAGNESLDTELITILPVSNDDLVESSIQRILASKISLLQKEFLLEHAFAQLLTLTQIKQIGSIAPELAPRLALGQLDKDPNLLRTLLLDTSFDFKNKFNIDKDIISNTSAEVAVAVFNDISTALERNAVSEQKRQWINKLAESISSAEFARSGDLQPIIDVAQKITDPNIKASYIRKAFGDAAGIDVALTSQYVSSLSSNQMRQAAIEGLLPALKDPIEQTAWSEELMRLKQ